ncbi:hypothetical protein ACTMSW_19005 [Micromonospora sp. BQ11]|uniref:hypothetical protein n=1 Tax=Micromonospora sp. BQ11 TaxID=3452212 RepID=UPI003F8873C5
MLLVLLDTDRRRGGTEGRMQDQHGYLSLTSLEFLGDESVLREQVERTLRGSSIPLQAGSCHGADVTGSVSVVVDASRRVESVVVGREWRSEVGGPGFPAALFDAYTNALGAALEQAAMVRLQEERHDPSTPRRPTTSEAYVEADEDAWSRATWRTLRGLDAELARVAGLRDAVVEETMSSTTGLLTLRIRAGSIVGISGDTRRIARADAGELQFEASSLLRSFDLADGPRHDIEG